jgi:RND family efflux transporter MFP subunit
MRAPRILLLAAVAACDSGRAEPPPPRSAQSPTPAPPPGAESTPAPVVEVVPVVADRLQLTIRLPGEIAPYEWVAIHPRVSGFVEEVAVDRGSPVKRGQVLARLSAPELVAQRAEAESKLVGTESTYQRMRTAAETPGVVANHDVEVAEAALKADQARVDALRTLESYLVVRAPFDGVITERNVHPGALVGPPSGPSPVPMLRMETLGRLRLTVAVPETDLGAIAQGEKAEFTVRTWPGRRFGGTIARVSHAVEPKTRTMPVELDVDDPKNELAPGMFAEVLWPLHRDQPSLLVPSSAVVQSTERTYVDRLRDGVLEIVSVQRGAAAGDKVEVFGELAPGDQVLRRGSEEMRAGTRLTARPWSPDGGVPAK